MKTFAVILCGSGFKDGSEIRESVAVLWALDSFHVKFQCFAPDAPQHEVVNCLTGESTTESRNQLVEAARIARGQVKPLNTLHAKDFAGLILPGGFGAAKNLCDFAYKEADGSVTPQLQSVLVDFHHSGKPIGAVCIAPAILALAFKGEKLELTVGQISETSEIIEKLGHTHVPTRVTECLVDVKNKIVTTPAYMDDKARLSDLFEGVRKLVGNVIELS